ncbi:MAG: bifunctional riboflavin kinase/FMN adenylyltransferase [Cycloclasticus sp. symbiont of Poecilosclerida sp. M]|nr:MAG: bifunctional riboflavin kinase/FMN adenylyltransferase [Cycloclasticus sp. symbiont of Poecilosclerida sp. M]
MKLVRHIPLNSVDANDCVMTIGNFDGVHKGHHAVLESVVKEAKSLGLPAVVMAFEPQPLEYFQKDKAPARLSTAREKIQLLSDAGMECVYLFRFGQRLANMPAEEFVEILYARLKVKHLIVGDDFCFGKGRTGNFQLLQKEALEHGFTVRNTAPIKVSSERVSSTLIRQSLAAGNFSQTEQYLGRAYTMSGRVGHGDKRGREIGFPTANIRVKNRKSPLKGVFVVTMADEMGARFNGVANVGTRPTVDASTKVLLEVHLFDFEGDLYQQRVHITFLKKLRDELKFSGLDELKKQINEDCKQAKLFLTNT